MMIYINNLATRHARAGHGKSALIPTFQFRRSGTQQATDKSVEFEGVVITVGQGKQMVGVTVGEVRVNATFIEDIRKTVKVSTGRWHTGTNLVDRLLGKELSVLDWAAETGKDDQLPVICSKWAALRPEERWWLFSMTVAETGLPEDTQRGWRRALFLALSDGEKPPEGRAAARSRVTCSACRCLMWKR